MVPSLAASTLSKLRSSHDNGARISRAMGDKDYSSQEPGTARDLIRSCNSFK